MQSPSIPDSVSYDSLLTILQDRLIAGEDPEDQEYFSELLMGLFRRANLCKKLYEKRSRRHDEHETVVQLFPRAE